MKIGILCAGDREFAPFEAYLKDVHITQKAMLRFCEGSFCGVPAVGLFSGVCKVNAAVAAQILIDTYRVECIINAGTAGGMDPALRIMDTVIADSAVYHDVAPHILTGFHPWMKTEVFWADEKLLAAARSVCTDETVRFGRMATGETFVTDEGRDAIMANCSPLCVDMETAAIAHVCFVNSIPWIAIRTITDDAQHSGTAHFEENCASAAAVSAKLTYRMIAELATQL